MADNTILNAGAGGDTMRTEDVGGGVKIPATKWHTGGSGVDGGPVTVNNPGPILIASGGLSVGVFQFHNADNQALGTTANGLNVGGVAQLLNVTGNLDRQRGTGADTVSALGVVTSANQYASPFFVNGTTTVSGPAITTVSASLSGTNRGAPWAIQVGSVLQVGTYGDPGYELIYVQSVNTVGQTFTAGFAKSHTQPFALTGSVYNQGRDATVADGATGQGFQAGATYLLNNTLNGGAGGWEGERSAGGELDAASGAGTAVAAEYLYNSLTFDRTRNVQGAAQGSGSLQTAVVSGTTSIVPAVVPVGLQPGAALLLWGISDTPEVVYTTSSYAGGTSPITLAKGTQFAHTSGSILIWSRFSPFGPGLGPISISGIGIEEEVVWSPAQSASFVERAADGDAMAAWNLVAEAECLWNGTTFDRARSVAGDGQTSTGLAAEVDMLWNGATYDRLKGISGSLNNAPTATPSGLALSGSTIRTVQYSFGTGSVSGSSLSNQLIAPQGANNRIRVLAMNAITSGPVNIQFQSTGSAGTVTNISSVKYLPGSGGLVLPESNHGWFQTNANEGLNVALSSATTVGIDITWIIAGP